MKELQRSCRRKSFENIVGKVQNVGQDTSNRQDIKINVPPNIEPVLQKYENNGEKRENSVPESFFHNIVKILLSHNSKTSIESRFVNVKSATLYHTIPTFNDPQGDAF